MKLSTGNILMISDKLTNVNWFETYFTAFMFKSEYEIECHSNFHVGHT